MAKRLSVLFITLIFVVGICSCDSAKEPPSVQQKASFGPTVSGIPQFDAYRSVLQHKAKFFSTDANTELGLDQLSLAVSTDSSVTAEAKKFTIVDLENDGEPEVVLWLKVNDNDAFGFEVLRYQDGLVCGYSLWYRAFMDLKADGTFSFSSGAADNGFGTMGFTDRTYTIDKTTYCESSCDSDNNQVVSHVVNHKNATEADFLSAIREQSEKAVATWHDLTDDNVETVLTNP